MLQKIHDDAIAPGAFALFHATVDDAAGQMQKSLRTPAAFRAKEPFGFADGISQPIIRGAPRSNTRRIPNHVVEAGEFILGYPDNLGVIPPSPTIPDVLRSAPHASRRGTRSISQASRILVVRRSRPTGPGHERYLPGGASTKQNVTAFRRVARARIPTTAGHARSVVADPPPVPDADFLATPPVHIKLRGIDATGPAIPKTGSVADRETPFAQGEPGLPPLPPPIPPIIIPERPRLDANCRHDQGSRCREADRALDGRRIARAKQPTAASAARSTGRPTTSSCSAKRTRPPWPVR